MEVTLAQLLLMAEDELTQYSTDARKIEKLRRKIGIALPFTEQQKLKKDLIQQMPQGFLAKKLETDRQTIALPFWGVAGLGLLFGISLRQPLDFLAVAVALPIAIKIQQMGWKLQAKRLLLNTFEEIENRIKNPETN